MGAAIRMSEQETAQLIGAAVQMRTAINEVIHAMDGTVQSALMDKMLKLNRDFPLWIERELYRQMPEGEWLAKLSKAGMFRAES